MDVLSNRNWKEREVTLVIHIMGMGEGGGVVVGLGVGGWNYLISYTF